jgi:catechol 2,3-dioxygenase-like lactoylglutathione lyase family enzyme
MAIADALRAGLAEEGHALSHETCLRLVARQFGIPETGPEFSPPLPIFRIFDVDRAMEFYVGFLGFEVDWEHRFGDAFPLYCQLSRGAFRMHLSEHSGDASPGAKAFAPIRGIDAFHAELAAKPYRYNRPAIQEQPWGREVEVTDPFSNRIAFCEQRGEEGGA